MGWGSHSSTLFPARHGTFTQWEGPHPLMGVPVWRSYPTVGIPAQHGGSQCRVLILELACPIPVWFQHIIGVSSLAWRSQCNVTPGVFQ